MLCDSIVCKGPVILVTVLETAHLLLALLCKTALLSNAKELDIDL